MKKLLLFVFMMAVCFSQALVAQNSVHCMVLDKTLSMTGHGGTDIWNDVQNYCFEWADGVAVPSTVILYTFDKSLYGPQVFEIKSDSDKTKVKEALRNVKVDGRFTYISSNLRKAVEYVYQNYPSNDINKRIYLITDGIEEEPGSDFAGVLKDYGSWRGDYDYLYYVDLRGLAPESLQQMIDTTDNVFIGEGTVQFVTVKPLVSTVNFVLGESKSFEQHFVVNNAALFAGMSFDVKIDSIVKLDEENTNQPNITITPSMGISDSKLVKVEEGKYKANFTMDFINNSECECDVYVGLDGRNQAEKNLDFEPKGFCIKVRNKAKGTLVPKTDENGNKGWRVIKVQ